MHPDESPFPAHWWGTEFQVAGMADIRPFMGTYGRYDFSRLPPLPFELKGDFDWLAAAPTHAHNISQERAGNNARSLPELIRSIEAMGLSLPEPFLVFFHDPSLQGRIRSCTDCFLDLCPSPVVSPIYGGHLVRFLADSQSCLFWYLYLTGEGDEHAILASPDFYGTAAEDWQQIKEGVEDLSYCAGSFEEFVCRFWIENEIWYTVYHQLPMPAYGLAYIEGYRRSAEG